MSKKLVDIGKESTAKLILDKLSKPGANTFTQVAPFSMGNTFFVGGITGGENSVVALNFNDELYVLPKSDNKLLRMNGSSSCWSKATSTPNPIDIYATCVLTYNNPVSEEREIHILGGVDYGARAHYKYNGKEWSVASELPYQFSYGKAVEYNGEIHIFGGEKSNIHNHYKWDGKDWIELETLNFDVAGSTPVVFNNEIWVIGNSIVENSKVIHHYTNNGWGNDTIIDFDCPDIINPSVAVLNGKLHVLGGVDTKGNSLNTHITYTTKDGWKEGTRIPDKALCDSSKGAVVINDMLWVVGYEAYYLNPNGKWSVYTGSPNPVVASLMSTNKVENSILETTLWFNGEYHIFEDNETGYNHFVNDGVNITPVERTPFDLDNTKLIVCNNKLVAVSMIVGKESTKIEVSEFNGTSWNLCKFEHELDSDCITDPTLISYMNRIHMIFLDGSQSIRHIVFAGSHYYEYDIVKNTGFTSIKAKVIGSLIHIFGSNGTETSELCVGCAITDEKGLHVYLPKEHQILCNKDEIIPIVGIVKETDSGYISTDDGIYTFLVTIEKEPYYTIV